MAIGQNSDLSDSSYSKSSVDGVYYCSRVFRYLDVSVG